MTNKRRKIGATGLSVLEIDPSTQPQKKTAEDIAKWCAALPIADTGVAAKKLFMLLTEISETIMSAQERYAVMEILRSPNKIICTSLKRHYIEQRAPLTENKLIIANLRQTLLTGMSDNYKLILEELHSKPTLTEEETLLMATTIVRIYYYLNVLLICRYQIYTYTPENIWHEVYLLYKYAKKRNMLELKVPCQFAPKHQTTITEAFMHIILLYATDPYQWRQREQHSLNKAIEMWALYPAIYDPKELGDKKAGVYIIDLDQDAPPTPISFRHAPLTNTCIAIDLEKSVTHLKEILQKMQEDHLKAKIENPNDPEFSVTAPTIAKLINVWSLHITRNSPRFPIQAQIKIVFGLNAAHFYINGEKEFNSHPSNLQSNFDEAGAPAKSFSSHLNLQLYEVSEEEEEDEKDMLSSTEAEDKKSAAEKAENAKVELEEAEKMDEGISKELLYHQYDYNIENINPHGFCIVIKDKSYPPFQAGEIVAFKNITQHDMDWGIGAVRWLRRQPSEDFQIGIQIIAPVAKAGGIQMLRADKPASRLSRCLVIPEDKDNQYPPMVITSALPLQATTVMIYVNDLEPFKATLTKEVDASGMYYQYVYSIGEEAAAAVIAKAEEVKIKPKTPPNDEEKTNTEFDKIWGDL